MSIFHEDWYSDSQCVDLEKLVESVKHLKGDIIEIGCWEGKSATHIANTCYPENLICNDTWKGNVQESIITGVKNISEIIAEERDVFECFTNNMKILTKSNYSVVRKDCFEWLEEYTGSIKFIHIDASHDYISVLRTIELTLPKMVRGGIMCGDDFCSANITRQDLQGGVERAVRESLPGFRNVGNLWFYIKE
jgi:hypothetical protein